MPLLLLPSPFEKDKKKWKWKRHKSDQNQIESRLTSTDFISHASLINIILTKPIFALHIWSPFTVYPDIDRCISKELCFRFPPTIQLIIDFATWNIQTPSFIMHGLDVLYRLLFHRTVTKRRKFNLTPTCVCNVSSINLIYLPITNK